MSDITDFEIIPATQPSALEAIQSAEISQQIATAHKFPRSMTAFKKRATEMATLDQETAESCIYVRPVGREGGQQKFAEGLSVRMAEIVGAAYGNLRVGSQIVEQTDRYVTVRGFAHDLESNFASTSEVKEPTVRKDNTPYSEGQRAVIAKAALSKARRDATFQVVPKALCKPIEQAARALINGSAKSFNDRKAAVIQWYQRLNIDDARLFTALEIQGWDDLTSDHLITLTGIRTAIKDNDVTIDEAFPPVIAAGKIGSKGAKTDKPAQTPTEAAAAEKKAAEAAQTTPPPAEGDHPFRTDTPEPSKSAGPSVDELLKNIFKRSTEAGLGKVMLKTVLTEMGILPPNAKLEDLPPNMLADIDAGWDEVLKHVEKRKEAQP